MNNTIDIKDAEIAMLKMRIAGLEMLIKNYEISEKISNMIIKGLQAQIENK